MENLKLEDYSKKLNRLIEILCQENKSLKIENFNLGKINYAEKLKIFNALCLTRNENALSTEFLRLQNDILCFENSKRKVVNAENLEYVKGMAIYEGDIRNVKADAIVCGEKDAFTNQTSENSLDSKVLLSGGLQIKQELQYNSLNLRGNNSFGTAKIVKAYNLPSDYIIYSPSPRVQFGKIGYREKEDLVNCYKSCLDLALRKNLKTVVFSSISTGGKGYPKKLASEIAVCTVNFWLKTNNYPFKVAFCVFDDEMKKYYEIQFEDYDIR